MTKLDSNDLLAQLVLKKHEERKARLKTPYEPPTVNEINAEYPYSELNPEKIARAARQWVKQVNSPDTEVEKKPTNPLALNSIYGKLGHSPTPKLKRAFILLNSNVPAGMSMTITAISQLMLVVDTLQLVTEREQDMLFSNLIFGNRCVWEHGEIHSRCFPVVAEVNEAIACGQRISLDVKNLDGCRQAQFYLYLIGNTVE